MKLIVISLMILLLVILCLFLFNAAKFLVIRDDVSYVDNAIIVMLMGSIADRTLGVAKLYKERNSNKIIMVSSPIRGAHKLESLGIVLDDISEISKNVLLDLGVKNEDINIVPGYTKNTLDEAITLRYYCENYLDIENIIIVTSKYHSFRSKYIFNRVFKNTKINVYSSPTPYDDFDEKNWYRNRESAKQVVYEYMKWFYFILVDNFLIKRNLNR